MISLFSGGHETVSGFVLAGYAFAAFALVAHNIYYYNTVTIAMSAVIAGRCPHP